MRQDLKSYHLEIAILTPAVYIVQAWFYNHMYKYFPTGFPHASR